MGIDSCRLCPVTLLKNDSHAVTTFPAQIHFPTVFSEGNVQHCQSVYLWWEGNLPLAA